MDTKYQLLQFLQLLSDPNPIARASAATAIVAIYGTLNEKIAALHDFNHLLNRELKRLGKQVQKLEIKMAKERKRVQKCEQILSKSENGAI